MVRILSEAKVVHMIQVDISGHPPFHWLKTIISDWHFLPVFCFLNFWGRFEALNNVFYSLAGPFQQVSWATQMEIVCKSYAPRKWGYQFTTSG